MTLAGSLTAFLAARLDEKAATAWAVHDVPKCNAMLYEEDIAGYAARTPDCDCGYPARVLREAEAKRKILTRYAHAARLDRPGKTEYGDGYSDGEVEALALTVRHMAAVDSDHPDYDPAWSPGA